MGRTRFLARLDIKGPNVIKGIQLEGNRVVGDPGQLSNSYYQQGIDEIIYLDAVASLYGRNNLREIVSSVARNIFIPLTVGGGIRSSDDVQALLKAGADKIAINTQAVKNPSLITELSRKFGSQCIMLSIEAKKQAAGGWEPLIDHGREHTGLDLVKWAKQGVELGAGEILLTSIDRDGTGKGFDLELCREVSSSVDVPVIISGGMRTREDAIQAVTIGLADAVAMGAVLHFNWESLADIKKAVKEQGILVRDDV